MPQPKLTMKRNGKIWTLVYGDIPKYYSTQQTGAFERGFTARTWMEAGDTPTNHPPLTGAGDTMSHDPHICEGVDVCRHCGRVFGKADPLSPPVVTRLRAAFRAGYAAHPGDLGGWAFDLAGSTAGDLEPHAWEAWLDLVGSGEAPNTPNKARSDAMTSIGLAVSQNPQPEAAEQQLAALRAQIEALPRYQMTLCNDIGSDYAGNCYMVAEPSDGSDTLIAGKEKWLREADVLAMSRSKPAVQRKRRRTILEKKRATEKEK